MKVHPAPRKRNITFHYNPNQALAAADGLAGRQKKLRRLPHIFSKVLELPFNSDADVAIQEDSTGFLFVVAADDVGNDVRAHAIHIHPGVIKVVIRDDIDGDDELELTLDDLELDRWRFRLPSCTIPELAEASYIGGELVVMIPKGGVSEDDAGDEVRGGGSGGISGAGVGGLVFVQ